jgi:conjugal transfer/entry exclusion protein
MNGHAMKKISALLLAALLTACGQSSSTDTVESLAANPERLKELRAQCKADRAKLGDALCNAVAEATRKRFMGNGTPYTPAPTPKN